MRFKIYLYTVIRNKAGKILELPNNYEFIIAIALLYTKNVVLLWRI